MDSSEFERRRQEFMHMMPPRSIAVIPTAPLCTRNRDIEYPFRPNSNFYYLTGFAEPQSVALLVPQREQGEYVLFCRERNANSERWSGRRSGLEGAVEHYHADQAFAIEQLASMLPELMQDADCVYYTFGVDAKFDRQILSCNAMVRKRSSRGMLTAWQFICADQLFYPMRLIKSAAELATMQRAADISAKAHTRAMRNCRKAQHEYQIEAELLYEFHYAGARSPAYPSIVAGGVNACILHYIENNAPLVDGELLLIDAGCEVDGYAADITRTFPINGRFSAPQAELYNLVLAAQQSAIDTVRVGHSLEDVHQAALQVLVRGLLDKGLQSGSVKQVLASGAYKRFYMHHTSHWLGMDVHDVGDYRNRQGDSQALQPGMVLTVEPGLYIDNGVDVPPGYRNIGIRIEDDVVVTDTAPRVLTDGVVKTIDAIEALVGGA